MLGHRLSALNFPYPVRMVGHPAGPSAFWTIL